MKITPGYVFLMLLLAGSLALSSCNLPTGETAHPTQPGVLETMVASTLEGMLPSLQPPTRIPPTQTPQFDLSATPFPTPTGVPSLTPSPTPSAAVVSGKVCYRTKSIPAMTAYFEEQGSKNTITLPVAAGQVTYTVSLPAGTYVAFAWLTDFSIGGLYSKAVPCGLKSSCSDHSALPIPVKVGDKLKDVDLCDWYAFGVPEPPDKPRTDIKGSIAGKLTYPSEGLPAMHVVAFNVKTSYYYWVFTNTGESIYEITNLPPGIYHVVAYVKQGLAGGYANTAHLLNDVAVKAGQTTTGADILDWSAPKGSFPDDPTKW